MFRGPSSSSFSRSKWFSTHFRCNWVNFVYFFYFLLTKELWSLTEKSMLSITTLLSFWWMLLRRIIQGYAGEHNGSWATNAERKFGCLFIHNVTWDADNHSQEVADLWNIAPSIIHRRVRTVFFVALLCVCQLTPALCRSPWWLSSTGKDECAKDFKDTEGNGTGGSTPTIPTISEAAKVDHTSRQQYQKYTGKTRQCHSDHARPEAAQSPQVSYSGLRISKYNRESVIMCPHSS
jgi:hypothetical protein